MSDKGLSQDVKYVTNEALSNDGVTGMSADMNRYGVSQCSHDGKSAYQQELERWQTLATTEQVSSTQSVLDERGKRYGEFHGHASITQSLKQVMKQSPNGNKLTDSQREALEMIFHKIGRILNGDPSYQDSWVDIAGYATLVAQECEAVPTVL